MRTFISVPLPRDIVALKDILMSTVHSKKANIKWVKSGNIHLTLKFLGHTPPDTVDTINSVIGKTVKKYSRMNFALKGTGCFPSEKRPRVLWLGVDGEVAKIQDMVKAINSNLEPHGFPVEKFEYIPHVTLARIKYPPKNTPVVADFLNATYESIPFFIEKVHFMSSELFPNGPIYSILGTHFLSPESEKEK
jgi:2'-5' RNA ligase